VGKLEEHVERAVVAIAPAENKEGAGRIEYRRITCGELDAGDYNLEYLIDNVLVAGQPCIVAGGKKCLKTSIIIDLGITLAMGGCFLGRLRANRACRVGIMTGESGLATIQETARRIARAAGWRLADIGGLVFSDELPQFGSPDHEDALRRFIEGDELEVVVIDPAYLCIPEIDHANLFQVGERLRGMSKVCADAGCAMVLAHHTRKTKIDPFSPPELEDIAWSGFQEFARQWLLVGRREQYEPGSGEHRLWLSCGGSAGHSALWAVDIAEGTRETPGGRYWRVDVMRADEARGAEEERKETQKEAKRQRKLDADVKRVVDVVAKYKDGETAYAIRTRAGMSGTGFNSAIAAALDRGHVTVCEIFKPNRKLPYEGYKLAERE
jgi:hypothetical protein